MTMKFDGSRSMQEHTIEKTNIAVRLKTLGMVVEDSFLVQFILNSLLSKYGAFQINYNTIKDKCDVNEFIENLFKRRTGLKIWEVTLSTLLFKELVKH